MISSDRNQTVTSPLRYGDREQKFRAIGLDKGKPHDVDMMADAFRKGFPGIAQARTDVEWLRVWESFVERYVARRRTESA